MKSYSPYCIPRFDVDDVLCFLISFRYDFNTSAILFIYPPFLRLRPRKLGPFPKRATRPSLMITSLSNLSKFITSHSSLQSRYSLLLQVNRFLIRCIPLSSQVREPYKLWTQFFPSRRGSNDNTRIYNLPYGYLRI